MSGRNKRRENEGVAALLQSLIAAESSKKSRPNEENEPEIPAPSVAESQIAVSETPETSAPVQQSDSTEFGENQEIIESAESAAVRSTETIESTEDIAIVKDISLYPIFNFEKEPKELLRWKAPDSQYRNNYFKGCKWSEDGSRLLSNSEDRRLRVFTFLDQQLNLEQEIQEGDLIYDFAWCSDTLLASTARGQPVLLRNCSSGDMVASFRPHNHLDELDSAHSLCFTPDGKSLYLGFNKVIRIFDVSRPGKECVSIPTTNKLLGGQTGIISCIAGSPDGRSFVAGSYGKMIGVYSVQVSSPIMAFQAHTGGVTQVAYSPDGRFIYSGGRKDPEIRCWDTRNITDLLCIYERNVETNQRIYFDIDWRQKHLVSGSSDGHVRVWDLSLGPEKPSDYGNPIDVLTKFKPHSCSVNGISLNPISPVLATASGQRVFRCPSLGSDGESTDEESYERKPNQLLDNSIVIFDVSAAE